MYGALGLIFSKREERKGEGEREKESRKEEKRKGERESRQFILKRDKT
jgi:hypothetical protein